MEEHRERIEASLEALYCVAEELFDRLAELRTDIKEEFDG